MTRSPLRTALFVLATLLLMAACSVAGAEWILRLKEQREARRELAALKATRPEIQFEAYSRIYSDERSKAYKFGHNPNARVKLTRGYYDFTFISNREGLRESRDYDALPASVIFLGDSVVEGASVENDATMDTVFENATGLPALNFGVASRGVYLATEFLRAKYKPAYNTKLVVFGFCINDLEESVYVRYFDAKYGNWFLARYMDDSFDLGKGRLYRLSQLPGAGAPVRWIHRRFREMSLVRSLSDPPGADPARPAPKDNYGIEAVVPAHLDYSEHQLSILKSVTGAMGAELVVVLFPPKGQLSLQYNSGERLQEALIPILNRLQIPYIDLYDDFQRAVAAAPERRWYHDELHFYEPGHQLAGEILSRRLMTMFPALFKVPGSGR